MTDSVDERNARADTIVYIVDDNSGVRHSLSLLLQSAGLNTVSCDSVQAFFDGYDSSRPGCLILDIRMPKMGGLELQKKLAEENIHLPTIIITGHADVLLAVRAMKAGAFEFFEKPFNDQLLLDSVLLAIDKSAEIFLAQREYVDFHDRVELLSAREREVMDLLVRGQGAKEIAAALGISSKTVDVHRGNILRKIQVRSVPELILLTVKHSGPLFSPE